MNLCERRRRILSNLLDYIRWRGDIPLTAMPLGPVDGLILAQLAMLRWENGLEPGATRPLRALREPMQAQPVSVGFTAENDMKLFGLLADSVRFGRLPVGDYVKTFDENVEIQFSAIAVDLPDGSTYVAFRGTDSTIVGWKEDFKMAFSRPVPAQEAARDYLTLISHTHSGPLLVGGHSKGGNLAMYAAATVEPDVLARILAVYNYDGPGLSDRMDAPSLYEHITGRLHSYVPQGSIVGLLLAHPDEYTVVRSNSIGILQHDPYSWQVEGPDFVTLPELSRDSARFDLVFRRWLSGVDESDRSSLIDCLFTVLSATRSQNFGREFWAGLARNPGNVFSAIQGLDSNKRRRVLKMLVDLGSLAMKPQKPTEAPDDPDATPDDDEQSE